MAIGKITSKSLAADAVTSANLAPGAVTISDIPDSEITADKLHTTLDLSTKTLTLTQASVTAHESALTVTQSQISDLSTTTDLTEGSNLYYTDARADARVALLVDSAPSTLDTLNELAAALGDDPNFATTVTNSIATKLPLAGGAITGNVTFGDNNRAIFGSSNDLNIRHDPTNGSLFENINSTSTVSFRSNGPVVQWWDTQNGGYYIHAARDGAVSLAYARQTKFATTATGIAVTGTVTAESISVNTGTVSSSPSAHFRRNHGAQAYQQLSGLALYWNTSNGFQDNTIVYGASTNSSLKFTHADGTAFNDRLIINSSGNVGIGTTNPLDALHIASAVSTDYRGNVFLQDTTSMAAGVGGQLTFGGNYTGSGQITEWSAIQGTKSNSSDDYSGQIEFKTRKQGYALQTKMTLDADGNVGIGITSPRSFLDVKINTNRSLNVRQSADTPAGTGLASIDPVSGNMRDISIEGEEVHLSTGGSGGSSTISRLAVLAGGNVGIGVGNPATKLEVYGEGSGDGTYSTAQVTIGKTRGPKLVATQESADNDVQGLAIFTKSSGIFSDNPVERVRITNNGNVGIGTTSPGAHLHVYTASTDTAVIRIGSASAEAGINFDEGTTNKFQFRYRPSNDRFDLYNTTIGSNVMSFKDSNGNVGIGTTSPIDKLNVDYTSTETHNTTLTKGTNTQGIWVTNQQNSNNMAGIHLATGGGTHFSSIVGCRTNNNAHWGTHLSFYTHDDNASNLNTANEKMRIHGCGAVTTPQQPIGSFSDSRTTSVSNGILDSSNFYNKTWLNQGNHMNLSNGRFTCPVAGIYRIYFRGTGTGNSNVRLRKNGSTINEAYENAGTNHSVSSEAVVPCSAGDYLEIQCSSANFLNGTQHKQVTFELIS